jgi:MHS family proline/betaine transporter-like MFS transporter
MKQTVETFTSLSTNQKEAIGLLSVGTFLEYFDLMLYIHMAVLLNELFFPKTDPATASLLSAFAFCSTYVFRPFGALLFGYIGDNIGRKSTLVITTFMMSISCFIMAILPTYNEIGIAASVIMISCRVLQSFAATGEAIGAEIYLTETLKPPMSYKVVSWVAEVCTLGSLAALAIASTVLKLQISWRLIFAAGCVIAFIGSTARTRLKETIEFSDLKRRMKKAINGIRPNNIAQNTDIPTWEEKVEWKTTLAYFLIYSGFPLCFYITYIYGAEVLKYSFHFSAEQIISHNLKLTVLGFCSGISFIILAGYFKPLALVKVRAVVFLLLSPFLSLCMSMPISLSAFYLLQVLSVIFCLGTVPAIPIFFRHFPVLKRFTYSSLIYSLSRAIMYVVTSVGILYLAKHFSSLGILIMILPVTTGFLWGVLYFEKLEQAEKYAVSGVKIRSKRP